MDFKEMREQQNDAMSQVALMNFQTVRQDFTFLENDLVICTWIGNNEIELLRGEKIRIDPYVGTMIFRKFEKEWKIIYAHETAGIPVDVE